MTDGNGKIADDDMDTGGAIATLEGARRNAAGDWNPRCATYVWERVIQEDSVNAARSNAQWDNKAVRDRLGKDAMGSRSVSRNGVTDATGSPQSAARAVRSPASARAKRAARGPDREICGCKCGRDATAASSVDRRLPPVGTRLLLWNLAVLSA